MTRAHDVDGSELLLLAIVRRCEQLEPVTAAPILQELTCHHPMMVVERHFDALVGSLLNASVR